MRELITRHFSDGLERGVLLLRSLTTPTAAAAVVVLGAVHERHDEFFGLHKVNALCLLEHLPQIDEHISVHQRPASFMGRSLSHILDLQVGVVLQEIDQSVVFVLLVERAHSGGTDNHGQLPCVLVRHHDGLDHPRQDNLTQLHLDLVCIGQRVY